jgi:hypothetical protein
MRAALPEVLLSACSHASPDPSQRPEVGATPSVGPSISETGASAGAAPSVTLPCSQAIDSELRPSTASRVVLGVVALPTSDAAPVALQTSLSGEPDRSARLFAKQGLEIKIGAAFEIVVPDEVANRFSIGWGSPGRRTRHLVVPGCDGSPDWLAYAGGYWAQQVGCMPLLVTAGGQEQRVLIGVGAPCPGQRPPPQPTQT